MKYVQPYGITDPEAPYINGDPSIGRQGSIPPAAAFEHPMREIVGVISKSKLVPVDTDLLQMAKGVRSQALNFAEDTGSVNTLTVAFDPPLTAYTVGLPIRVRVAIGNTGSSSIDAGAGRVTIRRPDGLALSEGDLAAGAIVELVYDGSAFQLVNYLGAGGTGDITVNTLQVPYTADVSATPNIIVANFAPAITTLAAGVIIMVKIAQTNTADTVINVNGFANVPVRTTSVAKLLPGDIQAGDVKLMTYDGTNFYLEPSINMPNTATINVPSTQFPTVADTLRQFSRKTIANTATLDILLAPGVYPPITVVHKDASNIQIRGTMLAAYPTAAHFAQTGNTPAARASDAANNIVMLRSRYGTEIRMTAPGNGVQNQGPGNPTFVDLLVTGIKNAENSQLETIGAAYGSGQSLGLRYVAVWGCTWGIRGVGDLICNGGSVCNCIQGFVVRGGTLGINGEYICVGNDGAGINVGPGTCDLKSIHCTVNGWVGIVGANASSGGVHEVPGGPFSNVSSNHDVDMFIVDASQWAVHTGTIVGPTNPPLNVVGNNGALIRVT